MDIEVIKILELAKQKTGKEIRVYADTKDEFFSTLPTEMPQRFSGRVQGVEADEKTGKTYFSFHHNALRYTGYIDGVSESDKSIAGLIGALLENGTTRETPTNKEDSLKCVILGECSGIRVQKIMTKFKVVDKTCLAMVISVANGKVDEVINFLENFKSYENDICVAVEDFTCAYVRFGTSGEEGEYRSITDYASLLVQSIFEEIGVNVKIGVGCVVGSFVDVAVSYQQAHSAVRMGSVFGGQSSVYTYKDYVLVKMLEDLPKYKLQEFLDILEESEAKSMLADQEMIATAEEFLNTSLNVSETSRNLYMHRNTLMYRLDKIERATGLDIRKFQDAMTFRLIMILHKLLG